MAEKPGIKGSAAIALDATLFPIFHAVRKSSIQDVLELRSVLWCKVPNAPMSELPGNRTTNPHFRKVQRDRPRRQPVVYSMYWGRLYQ
jgi:hypothetical protein